MGDVLKKNFPSATCEHCKKVTNISLSKAYRGLVSKYQTSKECYKIQIRVGRKTHEMKNAQIQAMHKMIKQLYNLMDEEQKVKAKKESQSLRDEFKKIQKEANVMIKK